MILHRDAVLELVRTCSLCSPEIAIARRWCGLGAIACR